MMTAPRLFESTAPYYARYRLGYSEAVFDFLIERFGLGPETPVLDLGCGPGTIARPLAARGIPIHAVDLEPEMLEEGMKAGVAGIDWQQGDDRSLERLGLPPLALSIMGDSFHWMDRDALLADLDRRIRLEGGVALLYGGRSIWSGGALQDWAAIAREVVQEFLGPERRAGGGVAWIPAERHETVLARSAFSKVTEHRFPRHLTLSVERVVGLQLSASFSSPALLGDKLEPFKERLTQRLAPLAPTGRFECEIQQEVLIAVR